MSKLIKNKAWPILFINFLGFYEFTLFATLLVIIVPILFPFQETTVSFTSGYLFLAIGFLARPAGAALFGYIGDYYGRKRALIISILMISLSTIMIGLLPGYDSIGSYALLLLAICRIFQGLSIGGGYSGAGLLMVEKSSLENRFLNGAVLIASGVFGTFVAALATALISGYFLPPESWRFLFLIGGCLGLLSLIWFHFSFKEARVFPSNLHSSSPMPWLILLQKYKVPLLCTIGIESLMNVPFYLVTGFMNTYFAAITTYSKTTLIFLNAFIFFGFAVGLLLFGFLLRRGHIDPMKTLFYSSFGMVLFTFPFFLLIEANAFPLFLFAEILLLLANIAFTAPALTTMAQLFPYSIRYRGLALGSCLGVAIFGGLTPYISIQLIQHTHLSWSPAFYLFAISLLGFVSILIISKKELSSGYLETDNINTLQVEEI